VAPLWDGFRQFVVLDGGAPAPDGRLRSFASLQEAVWFFRGLAGDAEDAGSLRDLLAARSLADAGRLSDEEVVQALARLALGGSLQVAELAAAPPPAGGKPKVEPPPAPAPAPVEEPRVVRLVELAEVVVRGSEGAVAGAVPEPGHARFKKVATRAEKRGGAWKQFINLGKDTEGSAKRHPDHGRAITLRARIEWAGGDASRSLAGQTVHWSATRKASGKKRPANLQAAERSGFGSPGAGASTTASAEADGWTAPVTFHLSAYAGDEYEIEAQADENGSGTPSGKKLSAGPFAVWRKFWFQLTTYEKALVPAPDTAAAAYRDAGADMLGATPARYKRADIPHPDRTLYPRWMVSGGADDTEVVVIGGHNRDDFFGKLKDEDAHPVKGHLVMCEHQWDPADPVEVKAPAPARRFKLTPAMKDWNYGILKPALDGRAVLRNGTWKVKGDTAFKDFWAKAAIALNPFDKSQTSGALTDANLHLVKGRAEIHEIEIELPPEAPDPTKTPVVVDFDLSCGSYWGGESIGRNMLITHRAGKDKDYQQAVAHEFGHGFRMVPKAPVSASLAAHPGQYTGHGGSGSHCSTGADTSAAVYKDGTCIMFHQLNPAGCTQKFCDDCQPHLRLDNLTGLS